MRKITIVLSLVGAAAFAQSKLRATVPAKSVDLHLVGASVEFAPDGGCLSSATVQVATGTQYQIDASRAHLPLRALPPTLCRQLRDFSASRAATDYATK